MRIAIIAPLVAPIVEGGTPLGGAQAMVTDLCLGLVASGHGVTLLAASGSRLRGITIPDLGIDSSLLSPAQFTGAAKRTDDALQQAGFTRVRRWLDDHRQHLDLAHAHAFDAPAFACLDGFAQPVLHTLHLPPVDPGVLAAASAAAPPATLICVSADSARLWREAGALVRAVVPNGVRLEDIRPGAGDGGYLLFAGRISPEKGADIAIRCAARANLPLFLVGGTYQDDYARARITPFVRSGLDWQFGHAVQPGATYLGPRPRAEVYRLMAGASAVLMPVQIDEAFGLVAVEAQAAGTPVVGFDRGSLREVVRDGETGILVPPGDEQLLAASIPAAIGLSRSSCRDWAMEHFNSVGMVRAYERMYLELMGEPTAWASQRPQPPTQT